MDINLEASNKHSVQAYSDQEIRVDSIVYNKSLILSNLEIISDWPVTNILNLSEEALEPLLRSKPVIVILGHKQLGQFPPPLFIESLAKRRIGLESMSIGAACRTFNVLLNEGRDVAVGIILD